MDTVCRLSIVGVEWMWFMPLEKPCLVNVDVVTGGEWVGEFCECSVDG